MDTAQFDRLTRALGTAPSRRGMTRAFIGLALGGAATLEPMADAEAKKCGPCRKKKKGKCKKKKPNDTVCDAIGKCLNGTCNQPPTCVPILVPCITISECCSGVCNGMFPNSQCGKGGKGKPCFGAIDCTSGVCTGFRCQ